MNPMDTEVANELREAANNFNIVLAKAKALGLDINCTWQAPSSHFASGGWMMPDSKGIDLISIKRIIKV